MARYRRIRDRVAKAKTETEKLFSAAVLRRAFELRGDEYQEGFLFVYRGVLRDLGIEEREVEVFLVAHRDEVETAIGRKKA